MPTVAELQRLEALVERLTPLTSVRRGELIRAQDWNEVVGALIELARAVLAESRGDFVPPHDHPEQVTVGWLDPQLRSLMQRGPLADPANVARVINLERSLSRLHTRMDAVASGVGEMRSRVTDVATRDLTREAEVTRLGRAVDGRLDAREDVLALRETLRSIQRDVATAVDAGQRLVVEGEPVDMADLVGRLRGVEELRERLRMPTGELLDARALELRLTELTNTLVTEEELDEALRSRRAELSPEQLGEIEERLGASMRSDVESAVGGMGEELRAELTRRLADLDVLVARAVGDALPGVQATILADVRGEIGEAVQRSAEETRELLERRMEERDAALRSELLERLTGVDASIPDVVRAELDRQLPAQLGEARAQITALAERVDRSDERFAGNEAALQEMSTRLAGLRSELQAALDEIRQRARAEAEAIAREVAALLVRELGEELRREIRDQFREEIRGEVQRSMSGLPELVRREFDALRPELENLIDRRIRDRLGPQ